MTRGIYIDGSLLFLEVSTNFREVWTRVKVLAQKVIVAAKATWKYTAKECEVGN